jgi:hypothetical protein
VCIGEQDVRAMETLVRIPVKTFAEIINIGQMSVENNGDKSKFVENNGNTMEILWKYYEKSGIRCGE